MRRLITLICLLVHCVVQGVVHGVVHAQDGAPASSPAEVLPSGQLSGALLERGTRTPLPGVLVTIRREQEAYEAESGADGRFTFYDLRAGAWELRAEIDGYLPSLGAENVGDGEATEVRIYLERSADNPYDVLVEAEGARREVTRHRLTARAAQTQPGTFGDPLLAVENLPSVAVVPFAGGAISMRGAASDESMIYLEGFRVPFFFHFIGIRSMIAPGMLDSIDVYPGGAPVSYGRQIGGVLSANLKRLQPERVHGYFDISLLDAGAFIETPVGDKVSVAAAARVSYLDQVMKAADATIPRYDDYQLMLTARPATAHQLRLFFLASDDSVALDTEELREANAQVTYGQIKAAVHMQHVALEHDYVPSMRIQQRAKLGYQHFLYDTSSGSDLHSLGEVHTLMARDTLRYQAATWLRAEVGLDAELGLFSADVLDVPLQKDGAPQEYTDLDSSRYVYKEDSYTSAVGGWFELELIPVPDLTIVPGVRVDLYGDLDELAIDPRIHARYALSEQLALKAGSGIHHAQPAFDELVPNFGNPNIRAERAWQHSAGVEILPWPFLQLDLTGFYHQLDDLSAPSDRVKVVDGEAVPLRFENTGEGRAYGLEAMLRQQLAYRLSGWVAYTLARTERKATTDDPFRVFDFDQTHTLALVAAYQLPWHMQLSTRFRYRTGRPTTPVTGATFVSHNDEYAPTFGATNSARLSSFHQLDLRLDKQWVFDRWSFTGYLDVQNVYNRNNSLDLTYSYNYRQQAKVQGLPLLAIVGFKAEY